MQYKTVLQKPGWLLAVGLVSLLGVVPASGQQPIPVIVKAVAFDRFVDRVEALGTLRANETVE
jgi:multidrug efflux pump subunit AcrA (membrane-fusion protein)